MSVFSQLHVLTDIASLLAQLIDLWRSVGRQQSQRQTTVSSATHCLGQPTETQPEWLAWLLDHDTRSPCGLSAFRDFAVTTSRALSLQVCPMFSIKFLFDCFLQFPLCHLLQRITWQKVKYGDYGLQPHYSALSPLLLYSARHTFRERTRDRRVRLVYCVMCLFTSNFHCDTHYGWRGCLVVCRDDSSSPRTVTFTHPSTNLTQCVVDWNQH